MDFGKEAGVPTTGTAPLPDRQVQQAWVRRVSVGPRFIIDQPRAISSPSNGAEGEPTRR